MDDDNDGLLDYEDHDGDPGIADHFMDESDEDNMDCTNDEVNYVLVDIFFVTPAVLAINFV